MVGPGVVGARVEEARVEGAGAQEETGPQPKSVHNADMRNTLPFNQVICQGLC